MSKTKKQRADELHHKFLEMPAHLRKIWAWYGKAAVEFDDKQLYQMRGFTSFKAYWRSLEENGAVPYSTIAESMAVSRAFPDWRVSEFAQYHKQNLKLLAKLPESKRTKQHILNACRRMSEKDFRQYLNSRHKTHIDKPVRYFIDAESTQVTVFDGAVALVQKIGEAHGEKISKAAAHEIICVHFIQSFQDKKPESVEIAKPKRGIELADAAKA